MYILFNEIDTEKSPEKWHSRVARICKNDEGSKNIFFERNFMTFIKARIYCSYRKENSAPHTFDQICKSDNTILLYIYSLYSIYIM